MTWRERLAAAWDYPRLREELAETRKELADSRVKCAQLEDNLLRLVVKCDELSDTAQRRGDILARTRQSILMRSMCVRKPPEATQAARDYANSTFGKWKGKCEI